MTRCPQAEFLASDFLCTPLHPDCCCSEIFEFRGNEFEFDENEFENKKEKITFSL
jgi:hypothetical protein